MTTNSNERKRFGRRAACGFTVVVLTSVAYYICLFKGVDLSWFAEYAKTMLYILGFVAGTLTITDVVQGWKK